MTEELVELRLAEQRDRILRKQSVDASQAPIVMNVSHASHRPILRFDRARRPDVPDGPTPVEINGEELTLDFKKIAVNVARREGSLANVLPEVLRPSSARAPGNQASGTAPTSFAATTGGACRGRRARPTSSTHRTSSRSSGSRTTPT